MKRPLEEAGVDSKETEDAEAVKRAQSERHKEYLGFRGLVLAELAEFGPRGLSFKGRQAEVPFYFHSREHCLAILHLEYMKRLCYDFVFASLIAEHWIILSCENRKRAAKTRRKER